MGKNYSKNWAELKRNEGNEEYAKGEYEKAIQLYSFAIFLSPNEIEYYSNRTACYMMLKDYKNALKDLYYTQKLNEKSEKCYNRMIKCHLALGDISGTEYAIRCFKKFIKKSDLENIILEYENQIKTLKDLKISIQKAFYNQSYEICLTNVEKSLNISPESLMLKCQKVECLILLNKLDESKEILEKSLKILAPNSIDVIYLRALYCYHIGDISKCIEICEDNFTLRKDHVKINSIYNEAKLINYKNKQANKLIKNKNYNQAINIYNEAIEYQALSRSVQSKLYFNRALVYFKMRLFVKALADCEKALNISPKPKAMHLPTKYLKILYLSAQHHFELEFMDKCVKLCEYALAIARREELKELWKKAKFEIHKRNERKRQEEEEAKRIREEERMRKEEKKREEERRKRDEERKREEERRRREEEKRKREEERKKREEEEKRETDRKEKKRREEEEWKQHEERRKEKARREEEEKKRDEKRKRDGERQRQEQQRKYWEQYKNKEKRRHEEKQKQEDQEKREWDRKERERQQKQQRNQQDSKTNSNSNNSRNFVKDTKGYYKTMGLNTNATQQEIKSSYKFLAKKHHPDKHPKSPAKERNQEIFKHITEAYRILSDSTKKYDYHRS